MEANAAKEVAANLGQNLGTSISITNQSAGDQLLSELGRGAIQGVSQYISRKMREEKVRTKRQVPPEKWEIVYGTYRENLRLYFLPTDEAEHGYWFGFESEIQKIQPVFKAKN